MIAEELATLLQIATQQPALIERVDAVAYRYRLMEARLKRALN